MKNGLLRYLKGDGTLRVRLLTGRDGTQELGSASLNLKDFKSDLVTRQAFNIPLIGQNCLLKCIVCLDGTENKVNVTRI